MFDLSMPWWEFIVRGVIVFCALLFMVRVSGRRTVGQFTPFDLLVVMLLSEAVSGSLSGGDNSLIGGLIIAGTLIALNMLASFASAHFRKAADILDGTPVLLGRDGKIFHEVLKKCRLAQGEVEQALREEDCPLEDMQFCFLEADGRITIQTKKKPEK
jgi:uncharacterized membrane protein YcaP (DUF421 family)